MPCTGGSRPACAIRATNVTDPQDVFEYPSLLSARKSLSQRLGHCVHHHTIKKWALDNKEAHGFLWELVNAQDVEDITHIDTMPFENVFTFRECVEAIFNGGKVRVTNEIPRRVSVFDVIRLILGENASPFMPWERLRKSNAEILTRCENYSFPGGRGGATPVTDSAGVLHIVNALPGQRARQFRVGAMEMLTRFLAGDQSLHDEIDMNAARQAILPEQHPLQMLNDEMYANPKSSKYILRSPLMKGKYIAEYYKKPVVYLLEFEYNGKKFIKVGWSTDLKERITTHFTELPGCTVYTVIHINNPVLVESDWKEAFKAYNDKVDVNGNIKTELFTGFPIEEGEGYLMRLCDEQRLKQTEDRELELLRMRMNHELEMKRLELQIVQAQLALRIPV